MIPMTKEPALAQRNIPFGILEVRYPDRESWQEDAFRALVEAELAVLPGRYENYDRKAVFAENPWFRFFKKFKKTYPVMLQFESVAFKGRPFPMDNPVTAVPFLLEVTTHVLSGTHDVTSIEGPVELYLSTDKTPFTGRRGEELHTYPGDFCARDRAGIIFSEIAGTDERTCARADSRHVFYPVFGTPDLPESAIAEALDRLEAIVRVLAPEARTERAVL